VAESDNETVGFLIVCLESKEIAHIVTIDVIDAWRRKGVGGALMDIAEEWARNRRLSLFYLETGEDNVAAHKFYKERGYAKVERVDGYYSDGTAAWVMAKSLTSR
jgi:ribosomal protein S18 acetylase RimI-like enzyme